MRGNDDQLHSIETDADSLLEAAYAGLRDWCRMWWYFPEAVIDVRSGDDLWRVRGPPRERVVRAARRAIRYRSADQFCGPEVIPPPPSAQGSKKGRQKNGSNGRV
jgi:hypothetical protein